MAPSAADDQHWEKLRGLVNDRLESYVKSLPDCPPRLSEAMAYSLLAEGKRLRPLLVLMAAEACGGQIQAALPAACALEMVHTYSLIHDDLPAMDDDDLRRGRKTNHVVFGEALAILAGDALLTLAFEAIATDIRPGDVAAACCADLASAAGREGMVAGQVADLEAEGRSDVTRAELEAIHLRKTGRLLRCGLTLGARIAGAPPETVAALSEYGRCLGLAFQITDDLLDVRGDAQTLGKATGKDAALGKQTYPGLLGVEASHKLAQNLIDEACQLVEPLGSRGRSLITLAEYVLNRDR